MQKAMSKETFYFSHDYNSRTDDKIKKLIRKHGMCGYGTFWAIVEDLYNNANALQADYDCIAFDLRTDSNLIKSIINDFDLFIIEGDSFGSESIERRLDERNKKSETARQTAFKRWNKNKADAKAMQTHSKGNAIKDSKVKYKKVKENIFIAPSIDEVKKYFKDNGYKEESAIKMFNSYSVANWIDSKGNPVKNWKQKSINVWFTPENKTTDKTEKLDMFGKPRPSNQYALVNNKWTVL